MAEYIERSLLTGENGLFSKHGCYGRCQSCSLWSKEGCKVILEAPAADVAPVRRGRWVPVYESEISGWKPEYAGYDPVGDYRCSVCGKDAILDCNDEFLLSPFCPNCGCEMDGGAK